MVEVWSYNFKVGVEGIGYNKVHACDANLQVRENSQKICVQYALGLYDSVN